MNEASKKSSFWTSLPGIITAIAGLITALTPIYFFVIHPSNGGQNGKKENVEIHMRINEITHEIGQLSEQLDPLYRQKREEPENVDLQHKIEELEGRVRALELEKQELIESLDRSEPPPR